MNNDNTKHVVLCWSPWLSKQEVKERENRIIDNCHVRPKILSFATEHRTQLYKYSKNLDLNSVTNLFVVVAATLLSFEWLLHFVCNCNPSLNLTYRVCSLPERLMMLFVSKHICLLFVYVFQILSRVEFHYKRKTL